MPAYNAKRWLSFVMALVMVFSAVPVQVFATETEDHDHEEVVVLSEEEKHEHSYQETVTAPDCVNGGYTAYVCDCGDNYTANETDALGHSYVSEVIDATYETEGYTQYTCETCGHSYQDNFTEKLVPDTTDPVVTEPEVTEPEVTEPEVTEPEVTEPEVTEPEVTEPEVTEPEVTEPEVTEPEVTEPEVTEPEVTEPEVTEPEVTEPEVTEPEVTEPEVTEPEQSETVSQIQERISYLVDLFGITAGMTDEDVYMAIVNTANNDIMGFVLGELPALEQDAAVLTEEEFDSLEDLDELSHLINVLDMMMNPVFAKTVSVLDGKISVADSANSISDSDGTVTATAKGSLFSTKTNTITITNESGSKSQISFNYTASSANRFKIGGVPSSSGGSYSATMEAGGSVEFEIQSKSGLRDTTATLKLSDFACEPVADKANITFVFDSSYGRVTVAGAPVADGETVEILAEGAALAATAVNGGRFLGWVDPEDGSIISAEAACSLMPTKDTTVKAVFVGENSAPHFALGAATQKSISSGLLGFGKTYYYQVGGPTHIFDTLKDAAQAAIGSSSKTIVLMNDGTLPAGDYTIPGGVTLLIPFDASNTMYTTEALWATTYTSPTAYRTLTLADGANLVIKGAMSLSAPHYHAAGSKANGGSPTGPVSFVRMKGNSSITVNNGGSLYAYGFVTGSGSVEVKSGGKVYEYFQIMDFRGGTQSSDMDNGVFPLSQYYIQNIEVPMTIHSGAKEYAYTTITMSEQFFGSAVAFIAKSEGMFQLSDGYVTKRYDGQTDRLIIDSYGTFNVKPIEMSVGTSSINSKDYDLPINSNMTVNVKTGSITINQDVAMLPGAEINIAEGATCVVGNGYNMYVYDADEWGNYASPTNKKFIPVTYAPGRVKSRTEADLVDAKVVVNGTVDASAGYVYTTAGGANVSGTGTVKAKPGTQTKTYQLIQGTGYVEIPLTSAKLKNADDTYMGTDYTAGTYRGETGKWVKECTHVYEDGDTLAEPTCTDAGLKEQRCKDIINCASVTKTVEIPALGHTMQQTADKVAATCEATGKEAVKTCSVCGATEGGKTIPALGHTMKETTAKVEPKCETAGKEAVLTCANGCGKTEGGAAIPALGHDMQMTAEKVEATCGADGKEAVLTCANGCGKTEGGAAIPALGHTMKETTAKVAATCEVAGTEAVLTCSVCGATEGGETIPALGHDMQETSAKVEPKCEITGKEAVLTCANGCGKTEGGAEIPALSHIWNDGVVTVEPTEETEGVKTFTCGTCGGTRTESIPTLEHKHNFEFKVVVTDPTCENKGYTTKTCKCGESQIVDETAALGHDMKETTAKVEPKCETAGKEAILTCANGCGKTEGGAEIAALGHDMQETTAKVEPKCETAGKEAVLTCANGCGKTEGGEEITAVGHDMKETAAKVEPKCETAGKEAVLTCANGCGKTEGGAEIAALGHDMQETTAKVEATCETAGKEAILTCANGCGKTEGGAEIAALGHDLEEEEAEPEFPATCETPGRKAAYFCNNCKENIFEEIPALGHNMVAVEAQNPTYNAVGWEAHEACDRKGCSVKIGYVEIPKLDEPSITTFEDFMTYLPMLEELAHEYVRLNPGKDPAALVIKYIRTGVDRYNSGSWGIMAGSEDAGFAEFVIQMEEAVNAEAPSVDEMIHVTGLKNIENFYLPNGDKVDFGHMFGTMDITYHNNFGVDHADVAGWSGDLVDLLEFADNRGVSGTLEEMIVAAGNLLGTTPEETGVSAFNEMDILGDLDGYYVMKVMEQKGYETGFLTELFQSYFTEGLTLETRAAYLMNNRFGGVSTRNALREAVYNAYSGNKVIVTLENTREFATSNLADLRKACCYAFADYICRLAGDYVDVSTNDYYTVFQSEYSNLAPGITQEIKYATSADGKQMVYYIATGDLTRDDVKVYANYNNNDPAAGWAMQRVLDQANAAQNKYGNPESEHYIPNYNVIASVNGAGFNMSTGEPGGLLVMGGVEYQGINTNGFFGILDNGTPVIGTTQEYNTIYKGRVKEGIAGFGTTLVKDGEVCVTRTENYYTDRAGRTAVGITKTGKVVFMVLDGRQEPFSCGGSMQEIAQIMREAGCVEAINLDGGGSTTFVAKQEGAKELSVVNRPSDGFERSVATSLLMVSTAASSTAFDHALVVSDYDYMTQGSSVKVTAKGVSATGNIAELPEGASWKVNDERFATITEDGILTALRDNGRVTVSLMLGDEILGTKEIGLVNPDNVYFSKTNINAVYGQSVELPVKVLYEGKDVSFNAEDLTFTISAHNAGTVNGVTFTAAENSGLKNIKITAALAKNGDVTASINVALYNQGEISFDFEQASGGDRQMAWDRKVSNSTTTDDMTYEVVNVDEDMVTTYTFAIDMTQIPIPTQLSDLIYMLPGADAADASAWNFLLQLAERISVLTEVKPVIRFDPRFDVDYSNMTLVNDYFKLNKTEFDETTNTLTLTLNWIDQTQAIDPATANGLCMVNGIKLTPKADADWGAKSSITAEHSGEISYNVYLRANALYSFAQKPENQKIYGLKPFVNPNDPKESGAYFGSVYNTFSDSYTLVNQIKSGWVVEDGGYAYYVSGQKHTGIQKVDGYYYNFGTNGVNVGKVPYTGVITDNGKTYYALRGELKSGWQTIGADFYYFSTTDMAAVTGKQTINKLNYTFGEDGKLLIGAIQKSTNGDRYYWAGSRVGRKWIKLEGGTGYVDSDGYIAYGNCPVLENATEDPVWMHFDETTGILTGTCDGFIEYKGSTYYCEDGVWYYGAVKNEIGIVYCGGNGIVKKNGSCYIGDDLETTAGLERGYYWCNSDGYIEPNGFFTIAGATYYFDNYVRAKGFTKVGEHYYMFNNSSGKMVKDVTTWISGSNPYGIASGYYYFQADGTMYVPDPNGPRAIVEKDGKLYFTIDGVNQTNGLNELDGEYYYANTNGTLTTNATIWISSFNDLIAPGSGYFAFGADGKMIKTGFVTGGGATYYYDDLVRVKGFTKIGEDYYFFNTGSAKMFQDATTWVGGNNPYGFAGGFYYFQADGTMYIPDPNGPRAIVEKDGKLYFTIDGVNQTNGLNELDGEYYYANSNGTLTTNATIWISNFNDLMAPGSGYFAFGADGKMVKTGFVTGGGATYYYDDLVRVKGLYKIGENYYFFNAGSGKMYKDTTTWVSGSNSYGIKGANYYFDSDGKMEK